MVGVLGSRHHLPGIFFGPGFSFYHSLNGCGCMLWPRLTNFLMRKALDMEFGRSVG